MSASPRRTDQTERVELPPDESGGPVPIIIARVEPHWFGMTPPLAVLAVACAAVVVALVLFGSGSWPFGLILLGVGALFFALYVEAERRRRNSLVVRLSADMRNRAESAVESLRARSAAVVETRRVHSELMVVRTQRRDALLALGAATYRDDPQTSTELRARLAELDAQERTLQSQLTDRLAEAGERIRQARLAVDETVVEPPK